ncbi:MAG TPA: tetratricopeptide repeat protein [Thermoanaerobaculia bacterium]|jgi:tetratricopeptide (TPR) repeat protein|nr:tetratricopeptide repeat protein [Thermoanaerobaculia bacterium]
MKPSPGTDAGGYGAREISRMLGLTVAQVRAWVRSGLLDPERGPHGELRFSPHDLAVLRSARGLAGARIGPRRIERALSRLREQIPGRDSLEELEIVAEGRQIVVTDGSARWQPESGQILMEFEEVRSNVSALTPALSRREREKASLSADAWYARGCDLEEADPEGAREAYARAVALDPGHADAHVNLGRLLHEAGDAAGAEVHYRSALAARPGDVTAAFNMGVALEDLGRDLEAIDAYEKAVALDPDHSDAYFNLAGACERVGRPAAAIQHLKNYRALLRSRSQ